MIRNIKVAPKDITDGLSNTAAMSERIMGDGSNTISTPESDTYQPGNWPTTADEALQSCLSVDVNDLSKQGQVRRRESVDSLLPHHDDLLPQQHSQRPLLHVSTWPDHDDRQQSPPGWSEFGALRRFRALR